MPVQAGWTFGFAEPPAGNEYVFRGVVRFQWKARKKGRWRVVRRAAKFTTAGHENVQSAQPAGFSETFCILKRPGLAEQARVVRDHRVDAQLLEPRDLRGVVDGPDVDLAALGMHLLDEQAADQ